MGVTSSPIAVSNFPSPPVGLAEDSGLGLELEAMQTSLLSHRPRAARRLSCPAALQSLEMGPALHSLCQALQPVQTSSLGKYILLLL